ncbi:hypothetical protein ATANTOWER_000306 [Ataeniobius toweri]|uniref:Uncharacterized protein n=1 Tax=Ataeniobius toweri TaxID=208326 RepID=A0ABU7CGU5_9TELE|nr:hypothetical protein [Ataeniobius toweri]
MLPFNHKPPRRAVEAVFPRWSATSCLPKEIFVKSLPHVADLHSRVQRVRQPGPPLPSCRLTALTDAAAAVLMPPAATERESLVSGSAIPCINFVPLPGHVSLPHVLFASETYFSPLPPFPLILPLIWITESAVW